MGEPPYLAGPEELPDALGAVLRGGAWQGGDDLIYALAGELDLATADPLVVRLEGLVAEGSGRVVLDLRHLTFIDSTGLRALIAIRALAEACGKRVVLRAPNRSVKRALDIVQFGQAFQFED